MRLQSPFALSSARTEVGNRWRASSWHVVDRGGREVSQQQLRPAVDLHFGEQGMLCLQIDVEHVADDVGQRPQRHSAMEQSIQLVVRLGQIMEDEVQGLQEPASQGGRWPRRSADG